MKKNKAKDEKQQWKSRRLSLSRETILALNDPALLELARGGSLGTSSQPVDPTCDSITTGQ
jgi:hypothetical protein